MIDRLRSRLARTPPGYRHSTGRILLVYSGLMVTVLLAALDQNIVATAGPHIVASIGGFSSYAWVFSAYLLFQTVTVPIYGKLGDAHGRRTLLLIAISIFLLGSALCGIAQNMPELIVFRSIQGIGAGGLIPLVFTVIGELIPPRDRGRYQGLISGAFLTASIVGPAVGGLIVDNTSWRWVFYVNIPTGGLALVTVALTTPRLTERRPHSIDYLGAALLAGGTGSLLLGLIWGGETYPWASVHVLGAFATALLLLGLLVVQLRRAPEPILPFEMMRAPTVSAGAACMGLAATCQFGMLAFIPLFVQYVIGSSATSSGLTLTPLLLGGGVSTIITGQIVSRTGRYRPMVLAGPVVFGGGMLLLWRMGVHTTTGEASRDMLITGTGMGLMMNIFVVSAQNAVPHRLLGTTTAFMHFSRSMGTTFGAALFGVIVNHGLPAHASVNSASGLKGVTRLQLANAIRPSFLFGALLSVLLWTIAWRGVRELPLRRGFDEAAVSDASTSSPGYAP